MLPNREAYLAGTCIRTKMVTFTEEGLIYFFNALENQEYFYLYR